MYAYACILTFSDPFKGCVSRTVNALASVYGFVAAPFDAAIGAVSVWQPAKITVDARIQVILKNFILKTFFICVP